MLANDTATNTKLLQNRFMADRGSDINQGEVKVLYSQSMNALGPLQYTESSATSPREGTLNSQIKIKTSRRNVNVVATGETSLANSTTEGYQTT